MTEPKIEGPFLYLSVRDENGRNPQWNIYVVKTENGKIRNCSWSDYSDQQPFADFSIGAFFEEREALLRRRQRNEPLGEPLLGMWDANYKHVYEVDQKRAEVMLKTLKTVNNSLERQSAIYGHATTFSAYVMRVAVAIKAKGFVRQVRTNGGWSYDDSSHVWLTPKEAAYWIDSYHQEYISKMFPEEEAKTEAA